MKKLICLLMAAIMMMTVCAMAEAPILVRTVQNAAFIDGTNLLKVETNTGCAIADMNGTMLTGALYARSMYFDKGIITAAQLDVDELNYMGAFRQDGTTVIPFQYGDIKVLNEYWAVAVELKEATAENYDYSSFSGDGYYLIVKADVYNLESGACVASLERSAYAEAKAYGNTINIQNRTDNTVSAYDGQFNLLGTVKDTYSEDYAVKALVNFRENGQYGVKDAEGNVILPPSFYSIYDFKYGYARVSTGDREGLIDDKGNVVIPAEFDTVKTGYNMPVNAAGETSGYNAMGYFCVIKDGKMGYADAAGNITCEPKFSKDILENNGASATYTDMEGKLHILAADGADTVIEGYEKVYPLSYMSGMFYRVTDADYNYGMIDWHGNVILPCEYDAVKPSGDGKFVMVDVDYSNQEIYQVAYPAAEAPAEEAAASEEAAAPAADGSAVKALLDSAKLLLNTGAAANKDAVVSLLTTANASLAGNAAAAGLLESAITLLNTDAAANAASVVTLLDTAAGML